MRESLGAVPRKHVPRAAVGAIGEARSRSWSFRKRSLQNPQVSSHLAPRIMPSKKPLSPVWSLASSALTFSCATVLGF